jgi:hypothetical protein
MGKKSGVKDYRDPKVQAELKDEKSLKTVKEGITENGKERMKPFAGKLTDPEIEALVAAEQNLGELNSMESTEYARLRIYVDELIYQWQEAKVHPSASNPDTAINRLIADRLEIEEQILALEVR